uniref:Glucose-6-phosphate isomerase n=1 Tax=Lygus hesperus TaxID=30085 RepID=A0A0A9Y1Q7_LYGHE
MAGVSTEKGTRVFKAYYDVYMKQASFRKSSALIDSLKREMTSVSRVNSNKHGVVSALANLLPRRHLFLFAAVSLTSEETIAKLFVKNPITGESVSITSAAKGPELRKFIETQVKLYTDMIMPVDEDSTSDNTAFVEAQVTIFARDAAFSFRKHVNTDKSLQTYFNDHA